MKFVCTKQIPMDGSMIYPGVYDVKKSDDSIIVIGAQGNSNVNIISDKEELECCGHLINATFSEKAEENYMGYDEAKKSVITILDESIWYELVGRMFEKTDGFTKEGLIMMPKVCAAWSNYSWTLYFDVYGKL